jgi:XRE family transcriptional regulator, fatty acid utilization regulator
LPERQLTGSRIRDRRLDRGVRQSDLAAAVGISPSYLNLIEHNRRRIGGKLLHDIARHLSVDPVQLSGATEGTLVEALRAAAASDPAAHAETARAEDLAGRFPGWAALVAGQNRRIAMLEARIAELADRLTHDPDFATALHQVISAVTSIRSTASILAGDADLDADWTARFHRNLYEDSVKLADQSRTLVRYLEGPGQDGGITRSPQDEMGRFLETMDYHVAALESVPVADEAATRAKVAAGMTGMQNTPAALLLDGWLRRYSADARALPLDTFGPAAITAGHDPARLAAAFGVGLAQVLRRIATLPQAQGHPPAGLAICDGAGALSMMKPVAGFTLPRTAAACPLWPLFQAMTQPGRGIRQMVSLPGEGAPRYLCYALAEPKGPPVFDAPPLIEATMLVIPQPMAEPAGDRGPPPLRVGTTCRTCPRPDCAARREPSILL